jgi:YegS/Rv2252/BmrU family lipid kinase
MSTLLLFANPISGRGRAGRLAERLERRLTAEGYDVKAFLDRADRIPVEQLPGNVAAAIVIGGDGTLRGVADQLMKGPQTAPPLLVVPMGTANLMGQHLGIKWTDATLEDQVLAALRGGRVVRLDTAQANGSLLLLVAGVGIDGQIVHELDKRRSGPISYLSYVLPAISTVGAYAYPPITVTVDGKHIFGPAPGMAFIGNVPEYGTGFPILPMASPTDGVLDVCVLPCQSREELIAIAMRAAAGEHLYGEGVAYAKGKTVRVDSPVAVPVQVDGEAAGNTPLDIHLLPVRLAFIVP